MRIGLPAVMAALLVIAACSPRVPGIPQPPPGQPPLADTSWVLEAYGEPGNLSAVLPGTEVTIAFDGHTEVVGLAGCNSYGGTYTSSLDGTLEFGELIQTEMYCLEPGVMDQEVAFMDALRFAQQYEYVNAQLHITGGGGLLVFSRG